MKLFIAFLVVVFVATAAREVRGRPLQVRWLFMFTFVVSACFFSLRAIQ